MALYEIVDMGKIMADRESISSLPVVEFEYQAEVSSRYPYTCQDIYRAIEGERLDDARLLIQYLAEFVSDVVLFEDF